ncbi:MAG: hypothetical protein IT378_11670 [Sandaracinaceae bacterium]|nr:hypothetical protein [Sandaracinaceae bacterium]
MSQPVSKPRPLVLLLLTLLSAAIAGPVAVVGTFGVARGQDRGPGAGDEEDLLEASGEDEGDVDVQSDLRAEGASKIKTYRFSGLGLDANLKSPQLLYFLNRLRAEFDRPRLPHRSFIPELQRSTKSGTF